MADQQPTPQATDPDDTPRYTYNYLRNVLMASYQQSVRAQESAGKNGHSPDRAIGATNRNHGHRGESRGDPVTQSQLPEPPITVREYQALCQLALDADATLMRNPIDRFLARRRMRRQVANRVCHLAPVGG